MTAKATTRLDRPERRPTFMSKKRAIDWMVLVALSPLILLAIVAQFAMRKRL